MKVTRRAILGAALSTASAFPRPALAQGAGPVKLIFPFAAGGGGDGLTRLLGMELQKALGETVIVENRAGADGRIGVRSVVTAPPDGRTILVTAIGPIAIHPSLYPKLPYDPMRELQPVSQLTTIDFSLSTGPLTKARSLAEILDWFHARPNQASYASPGVGTIPHLIGLLFANAAKIDLRHVPYRGTSPAFADLLGGQIALASTTAADFGEHHKAGTIRMLATSGARRSPFTPDVPTYSEQGFDIEIEGWYASYVPAGTPMQIVERYSRVFTDAVRSAAGRELRGAFRLPPTGTSPAELSRIQRGDFLKWADLIKTAGIKLDD